MAKIHSTAVLKNLPKERRDQIAEWCAKKNDTDPETLKPIPKTGGLAFAQIQLAADGVTISIDTLSRFFSWWELEQDLEVSFEREDQVLAKTGDPKKAREAGETMLMRLGLAKQNAELIVAGAKVADSRKSLDLAERSALTKGRQKDQQIQQKDRDLQLAERRVQLLEGKMREAKEALTKVVTNGGLSPETARLINEAMGVIAS
jgi:hypothetical protein